MGGGPAGAVAGLVLARAGRRVLLADGSDGAARIGEALPPAATPLLRDLGLWSRVAADGHLACPANTSSWGSDELVVRDFIFDLHGTGLHLDRARFDRSLRSAAGDAGARVIVGAQVDARIEAQGSPAARQGEQQIRIHVDGRSEVVLCRWVVDASGRPASAARCRGARRVTEDRLVAVYARFATAGERGGPAGGELDRRTLVEASADGWWYSALLPSSERIVAFVTDADLPAYRPLLGPEAMMNAVSETRHLRTAMAEQPYAMIGRPRSAVASSSRLDRVSGCGWTAAGDAAIAFDPLSSQGLFNALYTGMTAGRAVDAALAGDDTRLAAYAARIDEIHRLYRRNLATAYALETRWPDRPFWRRRVAPGEVASRVG